MRVLIEARTGTLCDPAQGTAPGSDPPAPMRCPPKPDFSEQFKDLAFIGLLLPAIGIAGFSLFLKSQGLGLLPSSVIAKTPMVAALGAGPSSFVVPTQVQNMMGSIAWTMLNTLVTTLPQRLAPHFGGDPSCDHRDEARRSHHEGESVQQGPLEQSTAQTRQEAEQTETQHRYP